MVDKVEFRNRTKARLTGIFRREIGYFGEVKASALDETEHFKF